MHICREKQAERTPGLASIDINHKPLAPVGIFSGRVARATKGGLVRGIAAWGFSGTEAPPPDAGEIFKRIVKMNEKFTIF